MNTTKLRLGLFSVAIGIAFLAICLYAFSSSARPVAHIQEWQPINELPQALASHDAIIHSGYLYIVGGRTAEGLPTTNVCAAKILSNGNLDVCKGVSALPYPLYFHAGIASASHLYILGGFDGHNFYAEIWRAAFSDNGSIGPWVKDRNLYNDRKLVLHDAVLVRDKYLYVIGGQGESEQIQKKVFYAEIWPTGELAGWQSAPDLPIPLDKLSAVVKDNVIYVTGGRDDRMVTRSEIYYAKVGEVGELVKPGWILATERLPEPREYHKALIFDDKLVVLGGKVYVDGGSHDHELSSMIYASIIEGDGNPKAWKPLPGLIESLQRFAAVNFNKNDADRLYILGGLHGAEYRKKGYQLVAPSPSLTLTVAPAHIDGLNDRLTYTIILSSQYTLSNVTVSNAIPANVQIVPGTLHFTQGITNTQSASQPGELLQWRLMHELSPSSPITIAYQVELAPTSSTERVITVTNEGVGTTWTYLGYPGNVKSRPAIAPLPYSPILTLSSQLSQYTTSSTKVLTYTINYQNGAYSITDVSITNTIPASVTVISGSPSCSAPCIPPTETGSNPGEKINWNIGNLKPGEGGQVFYRVRRMPISTNDTFIVNSGAEITWHYQNDKGQQFSNPITTIFPYVADFTLNSEPKGEISQTGILTYHIKFVNGPYALTSVVIANTVPLSVTLVSGSIRNSMDVTLRLPESDADRIIHWDAASLEADNVITMSYSMTRIAEGPIYNEGASISWSLQASAEQTFSGQAHSNGTRNPPLYVFLPVIYR